MKNLIGVILIGISLAVFAQNESADVAESLRLSSSAKSVESISEGKSAVDIIAGADESMGYSLRYAGVVSGSEMVTVDGQMLKSGLDYWVDSASGLITFSSPLKKHQRARVSYLYNDKLANNSSGMSLPLITLKLGQDGAITGLFGLTPVQRFADGTIGQTTSVGMNYKMSFGGNASIQSAYFVSAQRGLVSGSSVSDGKMSNLREAKSGQGYLMMQSLNFGGDKGFKFNAQYQDISQDFNGFAAMNNQQNFSSDQVTKWQKERGLTRMNFGMGYTGGVSNFSGMMNEIDDGKGAIRTMDLNFKSGSFAMNWNRREVDKTFTRFADLSESDAAQMAKEKGLLRQNLGASYSFSASKLQYTQSLIQDGKEGINRQVISFESTKWKATGYTQDISSNFTRFNDLAEGDRAQWAKEKGLSRQGLTLNFASPVKNSDKLPWNTLSFSEISSLTGKYNRELVQINANQLTIEYVMRSSDSGFNRMADLSDVEKTELILDTRKQFSFADKSIDPKEIAQIGREIGISRSFFTANYNPAGMNILLSSMEVGTQTSGLERQTLTIDTKKYKISYLNQSIDDDFNRLPDLIEAVKGYFGNETGMEKTLWNANAVIGKDTNLALGVLDLTSASGGVSRQTINFTSPKYIFNYASRSVSSEFSRGGDIADPEKEMFRQMQGYNEYDANGKFILASNIQVEALTFQAVNDMSGRTHDRDKLLVNWSPTPKTKVAYLTDHYDFKSENELFLRDVHDLLSVEQDLGKYGKINAYEDYVEKRNVPGQPSIALRVRQFHYEGAPVANWGFILDQKDSEWDDGKLEEIKTLVAKGLVSKNITLSLQRVETNRQVGGVDEVYSAYAMEYKMTSSSILTLAQSDKNLSNGTAVLVRSISLTQTVMSGIEINGKLDNTSVTGLPDTKSLEFWFKTNKPVTFLFLREVTFFYGTQSIEDKGNLTKDNQQFGFSGMVGSNKVGVSYAGVLTKNGERAIDRTYSVSTNPDPKQPFHVDITYKERTLPGGKVLVMQNYKADWSMKGDWKFTAEAQTLPETPDAKAIFGTNMVPTSNIKWSFGGSFSPALKLQALWTDSFDRNKKLYAKKASLNLTYDQKSDVKWDVGYSWDIIFDGANKQENHTIHIGITKKIADDKLFNASVDLVSYEDFIPKNMDKSVWRAKLDWQLPL